MLTVIPFHFSAFDTFFAINIILVLGVIFIDRKATSTTWAWIMIMLFIPILGFVLYLLIGQDLRKRKTFEKKEEQDSYLGLVHTQHTHLIHHLKEFDNPMIKEYERVVTLHLTANESLYTQNNTITIFDDGSSLFQDLLDSITYAKNYIHLEYYILREDELGNRLKKLLIQKAKEGVDVFLLYDDMGCLRTSKNYFYELKQAGVKVACFFPSPIPFIKLRLNYRNHRKICVIDGHTAYLGGFNIGDEYLGLNKKMGYWRDTHLKIIGHAVTLVHLQFLLDRRFTTKETLSLENYILSSSVSCKGNTGIQIVSSGPDSKYPGIRNGFIKMIHEATTSICIQTPYFIPDDGVLTALKIAALSGIDVKIMIPNKPDHLFVYWATYANIGDILSCGAKCYTYEKGFLHAKTLIIDHKICSVGTANFDIRSFYLNFEINAFIYDEAISTKLSKQFRRDLTHCHEVTIDEYNKRSALIKFKESISRLLSPLL